MASYNGWHGPLVLRESGSGNFLGHELFLAFSVWTIFLFLLGNHLFKNFLK